MKCGLNSVDRDRVDKAAPALARAVVVGFQINPGKQVKVVSPVLVRPVRRVNPALARPVSPGGKMVLAVRVAEMVVARAGVRG